MTARSNFPRVRAVCLLALALVWAAPTLRGAEFFVNRHSWHSGFVIARKDVPAGAWPPGVTERDFAGCRSLELGWGDRKFYTAPHPNILMGADAMLLPGPSVLHIAGFRGSALAALPGAEFVRVTCTRAELAALCRALGASFERDAGGRAKPLGRGLYGDQSQFYAARGSYWFANTCNTWTLQTVRAGGVPTRIGPLSTLSSGAVTTEVRRRLRDARRSGDPR